MNQKSNLAPKMGDIEFPARKVWIKTFGCQMNYHDSERLLSILKETNFSKTEERDEADLILFNTCAIRDLANSKFYSGLGEIKKIKANKPNLIVGIAGCVSQSEGQALLKKIKHLDFAFGTDVIDQINDMLFRIYSGERKFFINSRDKSANYSISTKITHGTPQAFVNIIKGCDKFCSYCIVPFTRGREKSRKIEEIVNDVTILAKENGIQEVTLLGQNVNSFGSDNGETLSELIIRLDQIEDLKLIRYTTSHPQDVTDELISVHGSAKKLATHLHLPVQSGSNAILEKMKRGHTKEHYLKLLEKLRNAKPDIVISSDIIVGFPNETEEEHNETLDLLEKAQFDFIYSYAFSARANTKAARMDDKLTTEIRNKRLRQLQKFQENIQSEIRSKIVGKKVHLLVEGKKTKNGETKWYGRTNCNRLVHFLPESTDLDYKWKWLDVEITSATAFSCQGKIS